MEDALRRFGLALARDDRLICDHPSALALVENLGKRALFAVRNGAADGDRRLSLFSLFIRLYRRHIRMAAGGDEFGDAIAAATGFVARGDGSRVERAIRNLPLELREALLLVVLERFSHLQAARTLDIPLGALIDRLNRARLLLAAECEQRRAPPPAPHWRDSASRGGASHLRVVK
jgi:RNA polymerase sigma-70 factor, ECF subfamily